MNDSLLAGDSLRNVVGNEDKSEDEPLEELEAPDELEASDEASSEDSGEAPDEAPPNWYIDRCRSFICCLRSFMPPGYGMFSEAFFLFSVGNLKKGIFPVSYPTCWNSNNTLNTDCPHEALKGSISYSMVVGVILGMLIISIFGDKFGRRAGSILTSVIMLVGAILMACSTAPTLEGEFAMFTIALAIFGLGVGGEYPLASASATERDDTATRGTTVALTFSMQGLGTWVYTALLIVLLYICGFDWNTKDDEYDTEVVNRIWRYTYGLGAAGLFILVIGRVVFLKESKRYKKRMKTYKSKGWFGGIGHFWHRLFGTASSWFVWSLTFYGNKLFQGAFMKEIVGDHISPFQTLVYVLINSSVALVGYYAAAYSIDAAWMGRRNMQMMGFFMMFILFLICGIAYEPLSKNPTSFQVLYYLSTFFGQWGPNVTCWVIPTEIFPTQIRATAHGFSAACGQIGALVAGVLFGLAFLHGHPEYTFIISAICGFFGLCISFTFIPEATKVSLKELDKYWDARNGNGTYDGPAVYKSNRSWCETFWNLTSFSESQEWGRTEAPLED